MNTLSKLILNKLNNSDVPKLAIKCTTSNSWKWIENKYVNGSIQTSGTNSRNLTLNLVIALYIRVTILLNGYHGT